MAKPCFARVTMVAQEMLPFVAASPDGVTLRQFKRHLKNLLYRFGIEEGQHLLYDQIILDVLETAQAVRRITERRYPTKIVIQQEETA